MSSIEWETPQDFFEALDAEFHFTMDVAASKENAKCDSFLDKESDGLSRRWPGVSWLNPPYNKTIAKWMAKAYYESREGNTVVALIQGRSTDTKWWHHYVMRASELRFVKGRLYFSLDGKPGRSTISSVVVVFRPYCTGPPRVVSIDTKARMLV